MLEYETANLNESLTYRLNLIQFNNQGLIVVFFMKINVYFGFNHQDLKHSTHTFALPIK